MLGLQLLLLDKVRMLVPNVRDLQLPCMMLDRILDVSDSLADIHRIGQGEQYSRQLILTQILTGRDQGRIVSPLVTIDNEDLLEPVSCKTPYHILGDLHKGLRSKGDSARKIKVVRGISKLKGRCH
jgi:hypothetical protein